MTPKDLILVTGASGFLGAKVVEHALHAGYAVRGTCRSSKAAELQKNCKHPHFQVAVVDDLIGGDLSEALAGVNAVLHIASPTTVGKNHIEVAVDGTLNLLRQARAARIGKIIMMSSLAACVAVHDSSVLSDPSRTITEQHWNTVTREEVLQSDNSPFLVYAASKALGERAAWEFVESNPEMDLVTVLSPFIYGPSASWQDHTGPNHGLSTNRFVYLLISGTAAAYPDYMLPQFVDVRDVAKACVLSLQTKPAKLGERRRILLCGGSFTWKQAARHVGAVRPELISRLVNRGEDVAPECPCANIDTTLARELLGMTEFIGWKQSVEDTVDNLLERERLWRV